MTFASTFSGGGCADLGLIQAGLKPLWFSEIDPHASAVLKYHHPDIPNLGDVTKIDGQAVEVPDVFWMSPPCQDLSICGKRAGLKGERSGLFYDSIRLAEQLVRRGTGIVLMEQVPGLFSSNGGNDFRSVLQAFLELRPNIDLAWRQLDSQYFGVAQRRKRVYIVVDFGGERAAEILSLAEGLSGSPEPGREAGERVAPTVGISPPFSRTGNDRVECEALVSCYPIREDATAPNGGNFSATPIETTPALKSLQPSVQSHHAQTFVAQSFGDVRQSSIAGAVQTNSDKDERNTPALVAKQYAVRRLCPTECERLQGLPDDWTKFGTNGKGTYELPDSARYRIIGNGVTVSVAKWIGGQIGKIQSSTSDRRLH